MCRELTPSSNFNEIVQTQTETADAVTRVRQKGSLSLAGVRDVRDSLKRLEIGSSLSISEMLSISSVLTVTARAKPTAVRIFLKTPLHHVFRDSSLLNRQQLKNMRLTP